MVKAIIWDYDGTIADTSEKNFNVSLKILDKVNSGKETEYPALKSADTLYEANQRTANWRDLYRKEFKFENELIDYAGSLWTEHQLNDSTEIKLFDGVNEVLQEFNDLHHAIVSQNSRQSIIQFLDSINLTSSFDPILGYEQVDIKRQKPFPDGLLDCILNNLSIKEGYVIYIGDHVSDFILVENANKELAGIQSPIEIISVGIKHLEDVSKYWSTKPDYTLTSFTQFNKVVAEINKHRKYNDN